MMIGEASLGQSVTGEGNHHTGLVHSAWKVRQIHDYGGNDGHGRRLHVSRGNKREPSCSMTLTECGVFGVVIAASRVHVRGDDVGRRRIHGDAEKSRVKETKHGCEGMAIHNLPHPRVACPSHLPLEVFLHSLAELSALTDRCDWTVMSGSPDRPRRSFQGSLRR